MINISRNIAVPSVESTISVLSAHNNLMPNFFDFDKICQYISYCTLKAKRLEPEMFEPLKYKAGYTNSLANVLTRWIYDNCDVSVFNKTKTGNLSLDKDSLSSAFSSGTLSPVADKLLKQYQEYCNLKHTARTLCTLMQFPIVDIPSFDNHRMIAVYPNWRGQNTGRIAMYDPAIQNFPREVQDIATVPKGWVYTHTDSGQIEPRTIYSAYIPDPQIQALIRLYNDAYYGVLHYLDLTDEEIYKGVLDFKAKEITDEMKTNRKILKTHNNAVMYGSTSNVSGDPIKEKMIRRIGNHPLRLKWIKDLESKIERGVTEFPTALGTMIDISKSDKLEGLYRGTDAWFHEMVKLAINNPIQGTAADLMRISVMEANRIISRETKNTVIINYVHDAGSFAIYEDEYDKVADKLKDIVSYNVEGWLPILADPEEGRTQKDILFADLY